MSCEAVLSSRDGSQSSVCTYTYYCCAVQEANITGFRLYFSSMWRKKEGHTFKSTVEVTERLPKHDILQSTHGSTPYSRHNMQCVCDGRATVYSVYCTVHALDVLQALPRRCGGQQGYHKSPKNLKYSRKRKMSTARTRTIKRYSCANTLIIWCMQIG